MVNFQPLNCNSATPPPRTRAGEQAGSWARSSPIDSSRTVLPGRRPGEGTIREASGGRRPFTPVATGSSLARCRTVYPISISGGPADYPRLEGGSRPSPPIIPIPSVAAPPFNPFRRWQSVVTAYQPRWGRRSDAVPFTVISVVTVARRVEVLPRAHLPRGRTPQSEDGFRTVMSFITDQSTRGACVRGRSSSVKNRSGRRCGQDWHASPDGMAPAPKPPAECSRQGVVCQGLA
jgi:hypothetical protein